MSSQPVIEALDKLHKELLQLQPAIRHIEAAQSVTEQAKAIPGLQVSFMDNLQKSDSRYKDQLLRVFKEGLIELGNGHEIITNKTSVLNDSIAIEIEQINLLINSMQTFQNKVDEIDFPERLQQIESTVKDTIIKIEASREVMIGQIEVLNQQIGEVDFKGDFDVLKSVVRTSAESNTKVIQVLKDTNLAGRIEGLSEKVNQAIDRLNLLKSDFSAYSSKTEKNELSLSGKVGQINDQIFDANISGNFEELKANSFLVIKEQGEFNDVFKALDLSSKFNNLSNDFESISAKLKTLEQGVSEQIMKISQKLELQDKTARSRFATIVVILVIGLIGFLVKIIR